MADKIKETYQSNNNLNQPINQTEKTLQQPSLSCRYHRYLDWRCVGWDYARCPLHLVPPPPLLSLSCRTVQTRARSARSVML